MRWEDQEWALGVVAGMDGEIEMVNSTLAGMRLRFADEVATQHLMRKFPEYEDDPEAVIGEEARNERLQALFTATREASSGAWSFVTEALDVYLDALPDGVVRTET